MECIACHSPLIDEAVFCPRCGLRQPGAPEANPVADLTYSAFISYRHVERDAAVAQKVQKAIETYRFPKAAAEFSEHVGEERRLRKAFRDEDELAAAPSLPESIRTALAQSGALVVVCSPDTAHSHWVQEEIELFAALHGRDRIFPVLAEGASAEIIPQMLQERVKVGEDGEVRTEHASPFAADFRPEAANQERAERMRLLAALADCPYDALRQRDRARKRSRIGLSAVAAVVLALVIGSLALYGQSRNQIALVHESYRLAAESRELFAQGDRYAAIEKALEALPKSSHDKSRPLVPEAQEALREALEARPKESGSWSSCYTLQAENDIVQFIVLNLGSRIATYDANGNVEIHSLNTGRLYAECEFPEAETPSDVEARDVILLDAKDLIVCDKQREMTACFDMKTGELEWYKDGSAAAACVSSDYETFAVFGGAEDASFAAAIFNCETGDLVASNEYFSDEFITPGKRAKIVFGAQDHELYMALDSSVAHVNLDSDEIEVVHTARPELQDLYFYDGMLYVSSWEVDMENGVAGCSIEGFDSDLNRVWVRDEAAKGERILSAGDELRYAEPFPRIYSYVMVAGKPCIACSAGRSVMVYDSATGEDVFRRDDIGTPANVFCYTADGADGGLIEIVTVDGRVIQFSSDILAGAIEVSWVVFQFPMELSHACDYLGRPGGAMLIGQSAQEPDKLLAYWMQTGEDETPDHELSFDELIEEADAVLEIAGRR